MNDVTVQELDRFHNLKTRNEILQRAVELIGSQRLDDAEQLMLALIDFRKTDPAPWTLLAATQHLQGRYELAVKSSETARDLGSEEIDVQMNLAASASLTGEIQKVHAAYQLALLINPEYSKARLEACFAYLLDVPKNSSEAIEMLVRFKQSLSELKTWCEEDSNRNNLFSTCVDACFPFLLAYQPGNHSECLKIFGLLVNQDMQRFSLSAATVPNYKSKRKTKLLVVSGHIRRHSVNDMLIEGMLEKIATSNFE